MTDQQPTALVKAKGNIEKSVDLSSELIHAMGMTPEQFSRIAINSLVRNPDLAECNQKTLQVAIMTCAQDGLIPDGVQAGLVPFNSKVQYIPMYPGLLTLARDAIPNISIAVKAIFRGDEWEYEEGLNPKLIHRPVQLDSDVTVAKTWENLVAVYAIAKYPGSNWPEFEVMSKADLEFHKKTYVRALKGPWSHPVNAVAMGKKTVLLRLLKRLPRRGNLANALAREEEQFGDDFNIPEEAPNPKDTAGEVIDQTDNVVTKDATTENDQTNEAERIDESVAEAATIDPGVL